MHDERIRNSTSASVQSLPRSSLSLLHLIPFSFISIHSADFVAGIKRARSVSRFFAISRILASPDKNVAFRDAPMPDNADLSRYLTLFRAIIPRNVVSWLRSPYAIIIGSFSRGIAEPGFLFVGENVNADRPALFARASVSSQRKTRPRV